MISRPPLALRTVSHTILFIFSRRQSDFISSTLAFEPSIVETAAAFVATCFEAICWLLVCAEVESGLSLKETFPRVSAGTSDIH